MKMFQYNFISLPLIFGAVALSIIYTFMKRRSLLNLFKLKGKSHFQSDRIRKRKIKRFKHFPISIPLLDGLYSFYLLRKYGGAALDDWFHKMDPYHIYELPLGPHLILLFRDASITQKILSSSDPGHLTRPKFICDRVFVDFLHGGLLATPFEVWTHQRKVISRAFTFRSFHCYMEIMNKHSKNLAKDLIILTNENNGEISGEKLMECLHFNIIKITLEFILGSEISDRDDAMQFSRDFYEGKEITLNRYLRPELYIPLVWWLHPNRKRMEVLSKNNQAFLKKIVQHYKQKAELEKEENGNEQERGNIKRCLIEEMLKHNASDEEIYYEIGTFLVAGHDTVSVAIHQLFHHLACHPEYQARCREEIDSLMGPYNSTFDEFTDLNIDKLSHLKYLEWVILESLRITPTVPISMRELKSPLKIDENCTFEEGCVVGISQWIMHRDERHYPDPLKFDPERHTPEEIEKREKGSFIPFLGGLRNCIGRRFAILEMKAVVAWILRNFEIHTEDGLHELKLFFEVTLRPERMYRTTFKRRK